MPDSQPVLVVGGTGTLGGRVVRELVERGTTVRALVREGSDTTRLIPALTGQKRAHVRR
jgi:uncharacterized protein YbjT (DUF2867 family)